MTVFMIDQTKNNYRIEVKKNSNVDPVFEEVLFMITNSEAESRSSNLQILYPEHNVYVTRLNKGT